MARAHAGGARRRRAAGQRVRQLVGRRDHGLRERFELFRLQARCGPRDAHRAQQPPVHTEHRRGDRGHALFALADGPVVSALADAFVLRARRAGEGQDHAARRAPVQRQALAHAGMVPQGLGALHAHEAGADLSLAHIESRALPGGLGERAQRRLEHVLHVEPGLVARPQPARGGPEPPVAVLALHQVAGMRQGAREPQHRCLVQRTPPAQLGQRQLRLPQGERREHLQCARDGGDAAVAGGSGTRRNLCGDGPGWCAGGVAHGSTRCVVRNGIVCSETFF